MHTYASIAQLIVAASVWFVWVFRFDNIVREFQQYQLSDFVRSLVGASKIALATLLVAGIWYPALVLVPAALMGLLMVAAQYFHFRANNPWPKRLPSLLLLSLCAFIVYAAL